jgi:hypothetical protein
MWVGWLAAADEAWLLGDKAKVLAVAIARLGAATASTLVSMPVDGSALTWLEPVRLQSEEAPQTFLCAGGVQNGTGAKNAVGQALRVHGSLRAENGTTTFVAKRVAVVEPAPVAPFLKLVRKTG